LDRDDRYAILLLEVDVDEDHPAPGAEEKAESLPAATERRSQERKTLEGSKGSLHSLSGVRRKAVRLDEAGEVFGGGLAHLHPGHRLELVEQPRAAGAGVLEPGLGSLVRAVDAVEEGGDVAGIGISLV
jgi:hypothetical protein